MQNPLGYISFKTGVLQTLEGDREDRLGSNQQELENHSPGIFYQQMCKYPIRYGQGTVNSGQLCYIK